ncbi:MAG: hypothetical protein RLZZ46_548, partial [Bacteroidota bacterium]
MEQHASCPEVFGEYSDDLLFIRKGSQLENDAAVFMQHQLVIRILLT